MNGLHMLLEGIAAEPLTGNRIFEALWTLPRAIDMTVIREPEIVHHGIGWAGVVIIAESHITVHSYHDHVFVDIFSCQQFDARIAGRAVGELLGLENVRHDLIIRSSPVLESVL